MKRQILLFLTVVPLVALSACKNKASKNPFTAAKEVSKEKDLQKTWQADCDATAKGMVSFLGLFKDDVKSSRVQYKFEGDNVNRRLTFYMEPNCVGDAFVFDESGRFKIDKNQKTNDGGFNIDMDFSKVFITMLSERGAAAANKSKLCDTADWAASSKEVEVTARTQDLDPLTLGLTPKCYEAKVPRKNLNVYRIDANNLYFGDDPTTAGQRPTSLSNIKFTGK